MAGLKLNHIYKVYPNGTKAVSDFTMDIEDKEFIIFVGPSGCGKSTTLRMIAGLEDITAGELSIEDTIVNDIEPKDRDIAMVFQNYALYPHMTVYDNMAFGLKIRKMPAAEIERRVLDAAEILGITEYLKKKPKEMSGGQRQRVALGRAIVREPKVFLLDEPLSNLDAKLRTQMRSEILKLHRKLQTTFIYVTHDQVEAMTMGTRIVVMKDGFVQQIDTPRNLYNYPCNKFVAGFIGTPQMNFFNGYLKKNGEKVNITFEGTEVSLSTSAEHFTKTNPLYLNGDKKVIIGIRAEHVSSNASAYPNKAVCRVSHYEDLGTDCQVYADFDTEAALLESPYMNCLNCKPEKTENGIKLVIGGINTELTVPSDVLPLLADSACEQFAHAYIHAEHISHDVKKYPCKAKCKVAYCKYNGTNWDVYADLDLNNEDNDHPNAKIIFKAPVKSKYEGGEILDISIDMKYLHLRNIETRAIIPASETENILSNPTKVVLKAPAGSEFESDTLLNVSLDLSHLHLFDAETEETISPRIPTGVPAPATVANNVMHVYDKDITLPSAIALENGKYTVIVPPNAVKLQETATPDSIEAVLDSEEKIAGKKLLKLKAGTAVLYAIQDIDNESENKPTAAKTAPKSAENDKKVYFTLDLKRISVYRGSECVVEPLSLNNSLIGNVLKRKVTEEITYDDGRVVLAKGFVIDANILGYVSQLPDSTGIRLLSSGDIKKLFEKQFRFQFSPYAVITVAKEKAEETPATDTEVVAENTEAPATAAAPVPALFGISATVEKILDYGAEKFAVCNASGIILHISTKDLQAGDKVALQIDNEQLSIFDVERDIQIV